MEFRLAYRGPLKANGGIGDKQALRREFHRQLRVLWDQVPLNDFKMLLNPTPGPGELSILKPVGAFIFAPLVSETIHLICDLEITLLRPEAPGSVITQSGDIDNRLKTLFDGLRMPKDPWEIPPGDTPTADEQPFYCLLEDDNLITKVTVITDRLLQPASTSNEVLLVLRVETHATRMIYKNMGLG